MKKLSLRVVPIVTASVLALCACGGAQQSPELAAPPEPPPVESTAVEPGETLPGEVNEPAPAPAPAAATVAVAAPRTLETTLRARSESKLTGKAIFTETTEGVKVVLTVENVTPGDHGAHIHAKGDCSAPDGSSAGDHFDPMSHPHALPAKSPRHLGDLGNITVGKDGKGTLEIVAPGANLKDGDVNSFVGRAIIVHEKKDDGGQPTGNAGGRIGCGEIK